MQRMFVFILFFSSTLFAADPVKVCVAQPGGPEAKNWKLQTPIAHRIEEVGKAKQMEIGAPLLASDDEKHAKSEAQEKACTYVLLSTLESNRPQVYGSLNPNPTAKTVGNIDQSTAATPADITLKYKLITPDGKKINSSSVLMSLRDAKSPPDFEAAARKLIDDVATQVAGALSK